MAIAQDNLPKEGLAKVDLGKVGLAKVDLGKVGLANLGLAKLEDLAKVDLANLVGMGKVGLVEEVLAKVDKVVEALDQPTKTKGTATKIGHHTSNTILDAEMLLE